MSKRPLIYELIDNESGAILYQSESKSDAFRDVRQMLINEPFLQTDASFIIIQNGKQVKILARFTGEAMRELLDDEV
jgi:hypothetical protein